VHVYLQGVDIPHLFPRMLCGLELGICFSFCYVCIDMYVELLIDFTFINIFYLYNYCLFTQAMVKVAMGHTPVDSSGDFHFALSWVFLSPF